MELRYSGAGFMVSLRDYLLGVKKMDKIKTS
ncbi:unnamed protein product, partial [marine sediment metagenome]